MPTAVPMGTVSSKSPTLSEKNVPPSCHGPRTQRGLMWAQGQLRAPIALTTGLWGTAAAGTGWAGCHGNQTVGLSLVFRVLTEARLGQRRVPRAPLRLLCLCPKDPASRDGSEPRSRRAEGQKLVTSASFLILTSATASQTRYCREGDKCHSQEMLGGQSLGTRRFEFSSQLVLDR